MFFFGCMKLYDGVIIDGFLCLIMCILSAALLASADNDLNPFNQIFHLVSKKIENVKIFKISIIVTATVYGFCCILMMIGANWKTMAHTSVPYHSSIGYLINHVFWNLIG